MATPAATDIYIKLQEADRMGAATGDACHAGSGHCGRHAMESTGKGNGETDGNELSRPLGKFTIGDFSDGRAANAPSCIVETNCYKYRYRLTAFLITSLDFVYS